MIREPVYSTRFDEAVALAVDSFRYTRRKGKSAPYVTHLFAVCALVGQAGGDEDQMIAAVLHDYLEDVKSGSFEELERRFGRRVAELVLGLSDTVEHPKPSWRPRKEAYLAHLTHAPAELKLVSAADKLHNACSIFRDLRQGVDVFSRFTGKKDGTLWYYREVVEALATGWSSPLLDELAEVVERVHREAGEAAPVFRRYPRAEAP